MSQATPIVNPCASSVSPGTFASLEAKSSLKSLAIRGSVWVVVGYGGSQVLRLVSNLILTRLLFPRAFGLMSLVQVFMQGLQMFSDLGVAPAVIQSKRGDDSTFLNTAWTVQVIRGWCIWLCSLALAWPISRVYEAPELTLLMGAAGFSAVMAGLNSPAMLRRSRHLDVSKNTLIALLAQAIALVVMCLSAYLSHSVWALVLGGLTNALAVLVFSHMLFQAERPRLSWNRESRLELFSFGRWIFFSTGLTFLSSQLDRLLLGKLIGLEQLGVYAIAATIYAIPRSLIGQIGSVVIFPGASRLAQLPRYELRGKCLRHRSTILNLMAIVTASMIAFGDTAVRSLYPPRYQDAGWMLVILSIGLWPRILDQTLGPALLGLGKLRYNPAGSLLRLALVGFCLVPAYRISGMFGVLVVIAAGDIPNYVADLYGLIKHGLSGLAQDGKATGLMLVVASVLLLIRFGLGMRMPQIPKPTVTGPTATFCSP